MWSTFENKKSKRVSWRAPPPCWLASTTSFHDMNDKRAPWRSSNQRKSNGIRKRGGRKTHLLPKVRLHILSFGTMDKGGIFVVKAVQSVGLLVDEGVVLRHELPSNFRRNNGVVLGVAGGEWGGHDDDEWLDCVRLKHVAQNWKEKLTERIRLEKERGSKRERAGAWCGVCVNVDKQRGTTSEKIFSEPTSAIAVPAKSSIPLPHNFFQWPRELFFHIILHYLLSVMADLLINLWFGFAKAESESSNHRW